MPTLLEIKTAVATSLDRVVADFTVASQDIWLLSANQVVMQAQLNHDFEFQRKLVDVSVNGVTGGSLDTAVLHGTATPVTIKSVIDMGLFDEDDNFRPVEWTTVAENQERQRAFNPRTTPRYPTDDWARSGPSGQGLFELSGNVIRRWPKDTTATTPYTVGLEVYAFSAPWTTINTDVVVTGTVGFNGTYIYVGQYNSHPLYLQTGSTGFAIWWDGASKWVISASGIIANLGVFTYFDITSSADMPPTTGWTAQGGATGTAALAYSTSATDVWTTYGAQFLQWATIVQLNHNFQKYVFRQEGALPPPEKIRDEGLAALIAWDIARYETNRRHGR